MNQMIPSKNFLFTRETFMNEKVTVAEMDILFPLRTVAAYYNTRP